MPVLLTSSTCTLTLREEYPNVLGIDNADVKEDVTMAVRWLFEADSFLFTFLLSACLGAAYFGITWLFAPLQNLEFDSRQVMDASLVQAVYTPLAWRLCALLRPGRKSNAVEE